MDDLINPYSPGAGIRPVALVGRDLELRGWDVSLERLENQRPARSVVLHGLRGVGKTVLLGEFQRHASARDWITGMVEAGVGHPLRQALAQALYPTLLELAKPSAGRRIRRALRTFTSFSVKLDAAGTWSFGVDLSAEAAGGAETGNLELDLAQLGRDLSAAATETNHGVALLIDEAQDLNRDELTAVCALSHQAGQRGWPLLVALAGLPSLPRVLSEAKSYSERLFVYRDITQLSNDAAGKALSQPAAQEGAAWHDDAVRYVVDETAGYPYFLQEYGQATWNAADGPDLKLTDARIGAAVGQGHLDTGFYRSRWERATPAQRDYLHAMAADGNGPSQSSEVAGRLGKTPTGLGPVRDALIKKGLIYAPEHGQVAYTVPRMADFIARQVQS